MGEKSVRFRIEFPPLILPAVMFAGVGWLEAGLNGLVAGLATWALSTLLAFAGVVPVVGQVAFVLVYNAYKDWLLTRVAASMTATIGFLWGLVLSAVISVFTVLSTINESE